MTWGARSTDLIPYSPYRARHVYYPHYHRDYRSEPYRSHSRSRSRSHGRRARRGLRTSEAEKAWERSVESLREPDVYGRQGDLGWTLEYATAWAYRNLIGNQTEVVDAIDRVRELGDEDGIKAETPFLIFDYLNRALFGGKLGGMVFLSWKTMASTSPGITSAPGVCRKIPRICIQLNKSEFEFNDGYIDELLDALIHHMIHAYFLVTCGAQPSDQDADGRLQDGLHFGVLLFSIMDLTRSCREGPLELTFYAAHRQRRSIYALMNRNLPNNGRKFIPIDPKGTLVVAAPADGQSHCHHDNRKIRYAQIKNWQVEGYSVAIDLDMESKGNLIWDFEDHNELMPMDRLKAPPSYEYIELIWDDKRVMVKRKHALSFKSIKKPLEKDNKMELKVPECSFDVFKHIYDYFNKKSYAGGAELELAKLGTPNALRSGPPVLTGRNINSPSGIMVQLEVFKAAESMKFEELQEYVLRVIWNTPVTDDSGMSILKHLYNEKDNTGPVHAELHKWARSFLARMDDGRYNAANFAGIDYGEGAMYGGTTNLAKIHWWFTEELETLIGRNSGLKDDCQLVQAQLTAAYWTGIPFSLSTPQAALPAASTLTSITETDEHRKMVVLRHPNSLYRTQSLHDPWRLGSPMSSVSDLSSLGSRDDMLLGRPAWGRHPRPLAVDWGRGPLALPAPRPYRYYGRDGRFKMRDPLTGDVLIRGGRSVWDD